MNESASTPMANDTRQIIYEFARAATLEGWWVWALLVASIAAAMWICIRYYRRDVAELSPSLRWGLIALRIGTLAALVFFFFDLQRRAQRLVTRPSEVVVLVDTSQSMSLPSGSSATSVGTQNRSQRVQQLLGDTDLLDDLSSEHRVSVYGFGGDSEPRLLESIGSVSDGQKPTTDTADRSGPSTFAHLGIALISLGIVLAVLSLLIGAAGRGTFVGPWILASAATLIPGIVILGAAYCVDTERSLAEIVGVAGQESESSEVLPDDQPETPEPIRVTDWNEAIAAADAESRIGDAVRGVLTDHDPATLAGIILFTDGQSNGGSDPGAAIASARRSEVAVYPIGLGSSDAPTNIRVVDLDAPRRVYPGDKFAITAVLQASGSKPLEIEVQLLDGLDSPADDSQNRGADGKISPPGDVVQSQKVKVNNDGTLTGIRFELEPESVGRRRLAVRVVAPTEDRNDRDDIRDARYEVVARKLKVLAIAGGPTREYRFVRNLLHRDKSIELDAWLQTGQTGMSQDANRLLMSFPQTAEELFQYDAIAMFDPDWTAIQPEQLDLLDRWLSQQAGGMVLVAGPVYHPLWIRRQTDPRVSRIRGFFPVNLSTQSPLLSGGRQGGQTPWPPQFTPEARRAEFFWIAETPESSFEVWDDFDGVYDYVDAKSAKPGAKVYSYFSDPTTEIAGSLPIYQASQFYGAGRIYFQGSGEMWRLRGESDAYFDSYYTKLIRWVSEGRLLRDSNRGILLIDSSRAMVGDTITVRAVLSDEQFEPLDVPEVQAKLLAPSGRIDDLRLLPLKGEPRAGTYGGRFVVREAGSYEIRLTLGDALDEQVLRQSVQVRLPTIELERPRRNDAELTQFASTTGGVFLPMNDDTSDESIRAELIGSIRPQPQTTILPGTPDVDFGERRNVVLMWLIATMLTMEWVTRRLHRLA
ncbi:von Willebrand factor type A domain protein [Rubripirellula lacrimiformis]|uniref:von Willebrand factor type A domain protein n=1 Tax=Rubripirellula lacrimiformis TaxID=1930273 RepID=A0A517N954_9BACT|nr:vWA domain-containing protein [Rubripirellula lacrimiformis]QDT03661.1 von Willebrand factor type A domain protein [Rubripirellula lacrimiformis]